MHKKTSGWLITIIVIALILRVSLLLATFPDLTQAESPDTANYFEYAQAIREGKLWSYPSALRTPIYPLFLAMFSLQPLLIILAQIIVSLFSVYMTYLLSLQLLNNMKVSLLASAFIATSLESITHAYYLLTETLFTILFLTSIYAVVRAHKKDDYKWVAISAFCMAGAVLTRPIALYFPIFMILILWNNTSWKMNLKRIALFAGIMLAFIGMWVVRNSIILALPTISTISSQNLLYYNAASLEAFQTGENEAVVRSRLSEQVDQTIHKRGIELNEANRDRVAKELAKEIILSDPFRYAFIHLKSDFNNLLPDTDILEILGFAQGQKGTLDYIKQHGLLAGIAYYFEGKLGLVFILLPSIILLLIVYSGTAIAVGDFLRKKQWYALAVLFFPILYGVLLPGSPSNPRFRVPLMPFFSIMAAYGLIILWNFFRKKRDVKSIDYNFLTVSSS